MSKHLKVLREVGLVRVEPRAQQRVYELQAKPLRELHGWLDRYRRLWDARFNALDELLVELENNKETSQCPQEAKMKVLDERHSGRARVRARAGHPPSLRARPQTVFDAMTKPELLRRWWAPQSLGVVLFECESDPRVGGRYRYVFGRPGEPPMAFSASIRKSYRASAGLHADLRAHARHR